MKDMTVNIDTLLLWF